MSVTNNHGKYVFVCDGCDEDIDTRMRDFYDAIDVIKEAGWRSRKNDGENKWYHFCPECQ